MQVNTQTTVSRFDLHLEKMEADARVRLGKKPTREEIRAYDEEKLWPLYHGRCAMCISVPAVCFHEIEPKSKRPGDWWLPTNRVPLCSICHDIVHETGTAANAEQLRENRRRLLSVLMI